MQWEPFQLDVSPFFPWSWATTLKNNSGVRVISKDFNCQLSRISQVELTGNRPVSPSLPKPGDQVVQGKETDFEFYKWRSEWTLVMFKLASGSNGACIGSLQVDSWQCKLQPDFRSHTFHISAEAELRSPSKGSRIQVQHDGRRVGMVQKSPKPILNYDHRSWPCGINAT